MSSLSVLGLAVLEARWIEEAFLMVAACLGMMSLIHGTRRHRSIVPVLWYTIGMLLLLVVRPAMPSAPWEVLVGVLGALSVMRAHWRSAIRADMGPATSTTT